MIQVTANVFVEMSIPVCNLGFVVTNQGIVMIDTPINPKDAVEWQNEINKKGELRYLINTEEHTDHYRGTWFFPGPLISSEEARKKLARIPLAEFFEGVKRKDPNVLSLPFMKGFTLRLADITFNDQMELYLGDHTIKLLSLPGHTSGGIGVYIPEERIVFASDCIFNRQKSWLVEADPDLWLNSLSKIGALDVDTIVPGHGPICSKDYLDEQATLIKKWVEVVQLAIRKGWTEAEAVNNIASPDPYPIGPKIPFTEAQVHQQNISRLYSLYA